MGVTDRKGRPNLSLEDKYLKYGKKVVAHYESKGFEIIHSTSSSSYRGIKGLKCSYSCATISSILYHGYKTVMSLKIEQTLNKKDTTS